MGNWIKVVTHPLGLGGFALFLLFTILSKQKKKNTGMRWALYAAALAALVGGIAIAYHQVGEASLPKQQQMKIGIIEQDSSGNQAVNAAGVQGDVNTNQSSPQDAAGAKKQKEEKK
jgi:hypothetical protein